MKYFTNTERLVIAGFILALLAFPLAVLLTFQRTDDSEMRKHTDEISSAITRLRQYYASEVVGRIQNSNGHTVISEAYKDIDGAIPIPATFSIDIGEIFNKSHPDTKLLYSFVSDYPFTTRESPGLDAFQQRAILEFRSNPELTVYQEGGSPLIGDGFLRTATPVRMQQACLNCHNTHPASTKRDWKLHDIRGIQEVSVASVRNNPLDFGYLYAYFVMLASLAGGSVLVFRNSARKLRESNQMLSDAREAEQRAAEKLQEKVEQLALLGAVADKSTFGVTIADCRQRDHPLIYVNQSFCDMTGLTREQSIGQNCRFLSGPDTDPQDRASLRHAIEAGLPYTVEILNYKANGNKFWNRLTVFPVGGSPGQPDYYVGYQVDVTALREAQQEREAMLSEIQEGQKIESLGLLVAGVSHEINNPLGIALTATTHMSQSAVQLRKSLESQGLLNREISEFLEDEKDAYDLIESNLRRAANLVKNFKEVASDRSQDSTRVVDLKTYLETLLGSFTPLMKRSRTKVKFSAQPDIQVSLDTGSFGQLITNLVVNAITHAFDGIEEPVIEITATKTDQTVTVMVCDNGRGIPQAALPNLFAPFYTTRRSEGGTGLGLFIALRIATDTLKGDLTAENRPSGGACFRLTFPARQQQ